MAKLVRTTGISNGAVDEQNQEIRFSLNVQQAPPMEFVAKFGVASQITSAIARMVVELEKFIRARNGSATTAAEQIVNSHVQQERWDGKILMRFTTDKGVPYTFAVTPQGAAEISDQLRIEAQRDIPKVGNA